MPDRKPQRETADETIGPLESLPAEILEHIVTQLDPAIPEERHALATLMRVSRSWWELAARRLYAHPVLSRAQVTSFIRCGRDPYSVAPMVRTRASKEEHTSDRCTWGLSGNLSTRARRAFGYVQSLRFLRLPHPEAINMMRMATLKDKVLFPAVRSLTFDSNEGRVGAVRQEVEAVEEEAEAGDDDPQGWQRDQEETRVFPEGEIATAKGYIFDCPDVCMKSIWGCYQLVLLFKAKTWGVITCHKDYPSPDDASTDFLTSLRHSQNVKWKANRIFNPKEGTGQNWFHDIWFEQRSIELWSKVERGPLDICVATPGPSQSVRDEFEERAWPPEVPHVRLLYQPDETVCPPCAVCGECLSGSVLTRRGKIER